MPRSIPAPRRRVIRSDLLNLSSPATRRLRGSFVRPHYQGTIRKHVSESWNRPCADIRDPSGGAPASRAARTAAGVLLLTLAPARSRAPHLTLCGCRVRRDVMRSVCAVPVNEAKHE